MAVPFKLLRATALLVAVIGAAAAEPGRTDVDVFVSGKGGYHSYRVPAIERTPDGSLLAFAEARKNSSDDPGFSFQEVDLVYKRSSDNGATWSPMIFFEHAGRLCAAGNPAVVVDRDNGKTWVFYIRSAPGKNIYTAEPGSNDVQDAARWSADNGKTWSGPLNLTPVARDMGDFGWRLSVPGPGGAIQTSRGRIIVAMWKMPFSDFTVYSDDHGRTWSRGQVVPGLQGGDECKVAELGDGRILFDMRQESGSTQWMAESRDGGVTWSHPWRGVKVVPVACGFRRLADPAASTGGWLIWTGPAGDRKRLYIRSSADDGRTFPYQRQISDRYAAYSDLLVFPDRTVGVLWERGKRTYDFITFTRLDHQWLEPLLPEAARPR